MSSTAPPGADNDAPRVVSLVPSVTETLIAWGVAPIAVTRFCERPDLPTVGGTKDPDVAAIIDLAPDLVVMCTEENRREDADRLDAAGVAVLALQIDAVDDVTPALAALAAACGHDHPTEAELVLERGPVPAPGPGPVPTLGPDSSPRRSAFVPIWRHPWMTLGPRCYGTSLLGRLGIDVVVPPRPAGLASTTTQQRYPTTTLEDVAELEPDLVIAPSEPYPFGERHVAELATVAPVVLVDGKDLFWWGIRTPDALQRLGIVLAETVAS